MTGFFIEIFFVKVALAKFRAVPTAAGHPQDSCQNMLDKEGNFKKPDVWASPLLQMDNPFAAFAV